MLSIVRTSPRNGYFVDIFSSKIIDGENKYHDYIYHNMGTGFEMYTSQGTPLPLTDAPLDSLSGKGYSYFTTLGSLETDQGFRTDFHLGVDDTHMSMFMLGAKGRTVYQLNSLFNHRYYEPSLRQLPVPAVLVRQEGEAWDKPFIAVYEPYGNGAEPQIKSIYKGRTQEQVVFPN